MGISGNILADVPALLAEERFTTLLKTPGLHIERIVSTGQATPPGKWLQQERGEWVVVLAGSAALRFEDENEEFRLLPGDYVEIKAGKRHRVEWTDDAGPTIWLAIHYG